MFVAMMEKVKQKWNDSAEQQHHPPALFDSPIEQDPK
jgi:hypothetical protein